MVNNRRVHRNSCPVDNEECECKKTSKIKDIEVKETKESSIKTNVSCSVCGESYQNNGNSHCPYCKTCEHCN